MRKNRFIKMFIVLFIISIIAITVISIIVKYQVEGETNMPFEISKIMVISTAGGIQKEQTENKWDLDLIQSNDVYIDIIKNKNYNKEEIIDKIIIDNLTIETKPLKGEVKTYRLNGETGALTNSEDARIENSLEYTGSEKSNLKNLQIANQGGLILLRFVNENLGNYTSNDDTEIRHDGTLLGKIGITNEEIKFTVSFDLSIELKSEKKYKTNIVLEMPTGDIVQEGTTNYQMNDDNIVFKRY